ncbi:LCP family protein [Brevibacillus borstelensis]|uniref:LCP family protein n=1 Tax=Brevibacillus borstelensis TaxID=45462 RepID=UPI00204040AD|nr:LCP family protein [Brevibacillus borstelensis]MCM3593925.1 LCP family protein [Brevibacillus borstelensis]
MLGNTQKNGVPTAKQRRTKRSKKGLKLWLMLTGSMLLLAAIIGGGYVLSKLDDTLTEVTENPYKLPDQPVVEQHYEENKSLSILIIGTDTRQNIGMLNTDVLMLAVADPDDKKVSMVSIPRDTRVKVPGYPEYHKINGVFAIGEGLRQQAEKKGEPVTENGVTILKKTMESMFGIPVDHYILLDFEGFKAVIDKLGGVEVTVDRELVYELPRGGVYRTLRAGKQVLNGEQALGYVRHRIDRRGSKYDSSDFDRNRRQQEVIKAVTDKMTSADGLTKALAVLETAGKHVKTDLSKDQIKGLAMDFSNFSSKDIVSLDNGALWDSRLLYTLWPRENMNEIRRILQSERGAQSEIAMNDAAIAEVARAEPRKPSGGTKPSTGSGSHATPAKPPSAKPDSGSTKQGTGSQPAKPGDVQPDVNAAPGDGQGGAVPVPGTGEGQPAPADMPPPDIVNPQQWVPSPPSAEVDNGQTG